MPFDLLVEALAPRRDLDHSPLFQVLFVVHSTTCRRSGTWATSPCEMQELPPKTARFDLSVDMFDLADGHARLLRVQRRPVRRRRPIRRLMDHYRGLLAAWSADPAGAVGALPMLAQTNGRRVTRARHAAARCRRRRRGCDGMVDAQARRTPDAPSRAYSTAHGSTYAELDARANRLAHHLLAHWACAPNRWWASGWSARSTWWWRCSGC